MKLTKDQRFIAYCIMLEEIESSENYFFCNTFYRCFGLVNSQITMQEYFPELYSKKPKVTHSPNCWFPVHETEKRIKILKQCIEETAID